MTYPRFNYSCTLPTGHMDIELEHSMKWGWMMRRVKKENLEHLFPEYQWVGRPWDSSHTMRGDYRVEYYKGRFRGTEAYFIIRDRKVRVFVN